MKPTLDLYIGRIVTGIEQGDLPWQWAIKLDGDVLIVNKSRRETIPPTDELVDCMLRSISMSQRDTAIHFFGAIGAKITVSFNPTQYAIQDPKHGGEVYPQWPEELEEAGITSHPEEGVSSEPSEEWEEHYKELQSEHEKRILGEADEFLEDTDEA